MGLKFRKRGPGVQSLPDVLTGTGSTDDMVVGAEAEAEAEAVADADAVTEEDGLKRL